MNQNLKSSKTLRWALIGFFLALIPAAWWLLWSAPRVEVVEPRKQAVVDLVISSGKIRSGRQSEVGSEVAGVVVTVWVKEGDWVASGQKLVDLVVDETRLKQEQSRLAADTARLELNRVRRGPQAEEINRARSELARAEAVRIQAELDFNRRQRLFDQKIIAQADWERARTSLDQARAGEQVARDGLETLLKQPTSEDLKVAEARLREKEAAVRLSTRELQNRRILAPFEGLIVKRKVEPGQSVLPGSGILTLADMRNLEIYVETDENNLPKLRVGQKAVVIPPAYRDRSFSAQLFQIGPEVDPARGVVGLRFRPETLPDYVRLDMTVDVNVETARYPLALTLPASGLIEENGRSYVFLVKNHRAERREIQVLAKGPQWVALEGLDLNSQVIARATEVKPGQKIRPVKSR